MQFHDIYISTQLEPWYYELKFSIMNHKVFFACGNIQNTNNFAPIRFVCECIVASIRSLCVSALTVQIGTSKLLTSLFELYRRFGYSWNQEREEI